MAVFWCEMSNLGEQLIGRVMARQDIARGTLALHADHGTSMRSSSVASLLVDLDITKSHSRPHVSDDNPYSESPFKAMKYRPDFPARFGSIADARAHCQYFFAWNTELRHSGIGYMTPDSVHYGYVHALRASRQEALGAAFRANPKRFKGRRPMPPELPAKVRITPPTKEKTDDQSTDSSTVNS